MPTNGERRSACSEQKETGGKCSSRGLFSRGMRTCPSDLFSNRKKKPGLEEQRIEVRDPPENSRRGDSNRKTQERRNLGEAFGIMGGIL